MDFVGYRFYSGTQLEITASVPDSKYGDALTAAKERWQHDGAKPGDDGLTRLHTGFVYLIFTLNYHFYYYCVSGCVSGYVFVCVFHFYFFFCLRPMFDVYI